jgi:hypothetical protein
VLRRRPRTVGSLARAGDIPACMSPPEQPWALHPKSISTV